MLRIRLAEQDLRNMDNRYFPSSSFPLRQSGHLLFPMYKILSDNKDRAPVNFFMKAAAKGLFNTP